MTSPPVPDLLAEARACLERVFGFAGFRPGQEEVVSAVLGGHDVLAVMPTGAGKSLCYQLPALVRPGLTVVVSPLISLMRDQVGQLRECGVEAATLNSSNDLEENSRVHAKLRAGALRLLYVAPERLVRADTAALLRTAGVSLLAIDEAHCVSQWGHDFRPEYLSLGKLARDLGGVQTIALTATADAPTREEIAQKLFASAPRIFLRSFDRPNLRLAMRPKANARRQMLEFARAHRGESGIIYCASRRRTETLAAALSAAGHNALPYHAGLDAETRNAHQDSFLQDDGVVIVATVAFGMGIDKPDVRFVGHADLPQNVEAYYQEIGRAGRDGLPADTLTLYGLDDMRLRRQQIEESGAPEARKRIERQKFAALLALCEAQHCRRQSLLAYFEERSGRCGNCDLCLEGAELFDGTVEAQKAMSAILRTGERFGTEHLIDVLLGNASEAVRRNGHDALPTFGVGRGRSADDWRSIFRQLYAAGTISLELGEYASWTVTESGAAILRGAERVELRRERAAVRAAGAARRSKGPAAAPAGGTAADHEVEFALLTSLKELRRDIARRIGQPAYVVFTDRTLLELAALRPKTLEEMHDIHGIGQTKLKKYGAAFLEVVARHAT
ncbi:MAG TPA: DNA helicase RecQ [Alphaproteobacteria bacterium]|nr:DNA helicase RecQ [Alphaproteobacteria bacterium]